MQMIEVKNISKSINGKQIVSNINLKVRQGEFFALLGPNGAGKTTMIRLIMGVLKLDSGSVHLFGEDTNEANIEDLKRRIGVQNDANLYENWTVYENMKIWGHLYGLYGDKLDERINDLLNFFDIENKIDAKVSSLSKGMKQKVLLSRSIIHQPELLILDEPTSGLDPQTQENLIHYLKKLAEDQKLSILMCTHQLDGLEHIINNFAIIQKGAIKLQGDPDLLIDQRWPLKRYVLEATPVNEAKKICEAKHSINLYKNTENKLYIASKDKHEIPLLAKDLVTAGIDIFSISECKYTIKDLYFDVINEGEASHYE
ncbi:ABC transporter ATP-binding protein [Aerococcus sp. HMSC035B07]|uniref:ABC transporter ATP-binding protein n=2 Tax=unclassified Aerococcus TaxID=2618060 RepID=UPI0008A2DEEC|nr:ABC transporter ATP-binding protein [Aerococcus sp. HMSC035B07]KAB0646699.1 ABC transporter ATP-binding protein [Aerococcus sanguinicola]